MLLDRLNLISVFLIAVFLLPIVVGVFRPLTADRIFSSLNTAFSAGAVIASAVVSVCATNYLYSNGGENPLARLFCAIPAIWYSIVSQDVLVYFLVFLILLIGLNGLFQLAFIPLNKRVLFPLSLRIGHAMGAMRRGFSRLIAALWQLPKSVLLVLVFALLFNFYALCSSNASLDSYINSSAAYRLVDEAAVQPIMFSGAVQQIPEIINNTVDRAVECLSPQGRKLLLKVYINGVTVEEAVKSTPEIDDLAIDLVDAETDHYVMAETLYEWVSQSIDYDQKKAAALEVDAFASPSGAAVAFNSKTGVCFDKACLYAAMCRAVGVKVRVVTGHAFNGSDWMDHSWNQIYDEGGGRWVNVDTTFGSVGSNYFDRPDFSGDHRDDDIQGEW